MSKCKFFTDITASNKGIKEARAKLIVEDAEFAQEELITELKNRKRELSRKVMDLEDLSGDNAMALSPVKANFDAKQWVKELQETKVELLTIDVQLKIAVDTFNEYFGEKEEA